MGRFSGEKTLSVLLSCVYRMFLVMAKLHFYIASVCLCSARVLKKRLVLSRAMCELVLFTSGGLKNIKTPTKKNT